MRPDQDRRLAEGRLVARAQRPDPVHAVLGLGHRRREQRAADVERRTASPGSSPTRAQNSVRGRGGQPNQWSKHWAPVLTTRSSGTPWIETASCSLDVVPDGQQVGDDTQELLAGEVVPAGDADPGRHAGGGGAAGVLRIGRARHQVRRDEHDVRLLLPDELLNAAAGRDRPVADVEDPRPGAQAALRAHPRNPEQDLERARGPAAGTLEQVGHALLAELQEVDVVERAADGAGDAEPRVAPPDRRVAPPEPRDGVPSAAATPARTAAAQPVRARRRGAPRGRARAARGSRSRRSAGSGPRYSMKKSTRSGLAGAPSGAGTAAQEPVRPTLASISGVDTLDRLVLRARARTRTLVAARRLRPAVSRRPARRRGARVLRSAPCRPRRRGEEPRASTSRRGT